MENPKIYGAITGIMADVGAIGKDSVNEQQRFKYRGIDAVMNALQPAFIKHGLFVYPEILEHTREERDNAKGTHLIYSVIKVAYHFTALDGSEVVVTVIGEECSVIIEDGYSLGAKPEPVAPEPAKDWRGGF